MTIVKHSNIQQPNFEHRAEKQNVESSSTFYSTVQNLSKSPLLEHIGRTGISDASQRITKALAYQLTLLSFEPSSSTSFVERSLALGVLQNRGGQQSEQSTLRIQDKGFFLLGGMPPKRIRACASLHYTEDLLQQRRELQGERALFEERIQNFQRELTRLEGMLGEASADNARLNLLQESIDHNRRQMTRNQNGLEKVNHLILKVRTELRELGEA